MATTTPVTTSIFVPAQPGGGALTPASHRITSIDLLRGLVMIIMALDHTRDYFHTTGMTQDPTNLQTTTVWLFLTRFITHYCAPVFVFLAGTSGWLQAARKSKAELSIFLIKRGLWLVFAEVVLIGLVVTFDVGYHLVFLQTIWAIGISMFFLGIAVHLPFWAILATGAAIVLGHNALDFYEQGRQQFPAWYHFVHRPGPVPIGGQRAIFVAYPFLSWTGLMLLGYCFGKLYTNTTEAVRKRTLLLLGTGLLLLFAIIRATNVYGDSQHWSGQKNSLFTALSFINVVKYPPSLLYMCITIGPAMLFLAAAGEKRSRFGRIISVYGSVPFFYYVLHFLLLHIIATVFFFARGHSFEEGMEGYKTAFNFVKPGEGVRLMWVYLIWILAVIALYGPCRWFSRYKKTHRYWWLSYI